MNPHSKHRPLFFTPRSPWGGRLESQSFHRHMRASEDRKPNTNPNDSDIVRKPQPPVQPPSEIAKTIAAPANPATAEQMRQAANAYRITPQEGKGLFGGHLRGSFDYGRDHPKTEPTDGSIEGGYYSNPEVQDQLEEEELRDRRIQPPETGEPPKPRLPAYDEKKEKAKQQQSWGTLYPLG